MGFRDMCPRPAQSWFEGSSIRPPSPLVTTRHRRAANWGCGCGCGYERGRGDTSYMVALRSHSTPPLPRPSECASLFVIVCACVHIGCKIAAAEMLLCLLAALQNIGSGNVVVFVSGLQPHTGLFSGSSGGGRARLCWDRSGSGVSA